MSGSATSAAPCVVAVDREVPDWGAYLAAHPAATIYHDPRWGRILRDACGGQPFYLTARRSAAVVGVLLLVGQKSLLFGSRLTSTPYFDAAGILSDDDGAASALLARARELREAEGYAVLELRQLTPVAKEDATRTDKVTLWLDIADNSEAMWEQLKTKVRTKVRKTQKNDFSLAVGGVELVDAFHDVYSRAMRDLGSPPHGRRIFQRIAAEFTAETRLFVVRRGGAAHAASFTLTDPWGFHVPWSGSDYRYRNLGANRFLYWEMLAHAAEAGAGRFDFGRSTVDAGTYEFKREWGAEPVQLHWQQFVADGAAVPEVRPDSGKYARMVEYWKKLPLPVARTLGPWLIRQLS
ncbi:MAG: FemAB family PEP-CTERM system-associated protein [Deferrisomatales bacterium]|nr:FemAB family PEP-CTERM system-associated protein [Deferrisomatales bacterium]